MRQEGKQIGQLSTLGVVIAVLVTLVAFAACSKVSPTEPATITDGATGGTAIEADAQPGQGRGGGGGGGGGTDPDFDVTLSGTGGFSAAPTPMQADRDNRKALYLDGEVVVTADFQLPADGETAGCSWTPGYSWDDVLTGPDFDDIRATISNPSSLRELDIAINKHASMGSMRAVWNGEPDGRWLALGRESGLPACDVVMPVDDDPSTTRTYTLTGSWWRSVKDLGANEQVFVACPFTGSVVLEVAPAS